MKRIISLSSFSKIDRDLSHAIKNIVGKRPVNISLYRLSTQHRSIAKSNEKGFRESNERLEYLGDAVLGLVVAEYLFKKFPLKNEGFLTEIRSRIVNRDALNEVAKKIGVSNIVEFSGNKKTRLSYKSIYGDTLEALIGAVYLDRGYKFCRKFILRRLILPHYDMQEIIRVNTNYKSMIIEWAHQTNKEIEFKISESKGNNHQKEFTAELIIENETYALGVGHSKKKAEQLAAQKTCEILEIQ